MVDGGRRHKLIGVIPMLKGGGAERVMAGICSAAAAAGHDVTVLTIFPPSLDDYPLDPRCARESVDLAADSANPVGATVNNLRRVRALRRRMRELRPDIVLSFLESANVLAILAAAGLGLRLVVSERMDPRVHRISRAWSLLRRLTYRFADVIVVQTDAVARGWARPLFGSSRVEVLPNPLVLRAGVEGPREPGDFILAAGRLVPQKGFDTLLRAFAVALEQGITGDLVILGEGPERSALHALATTLGIDSRVRMPGRQSDITPWFRGARAFALSSRHEGYPNVLLEALSFGLPSVATDCPSGPADLLAGDSGLLVPVDDVTALAAALLRVTRDDALRAILAQRGRAVAHGSATLVMHRWFRSLGFESRKD
jgi:GalNAc-alpha-(1->4)-GalNAc-alpha-(1->3)-diNAcBac-PP-undecaprenol alpha-1,4-N-acetyl-D-galactosaminyltransferase